MVLGLIVGISCEPAMHNALSPLDFLHIQEKRERERERERERFSHYTFNQPFGICNSLKHESCRR